jgi:hypothetical protein
MCRLVLEKRRIRAISYRAITCQSDCRREEKGAARLHLHLVAAVPRALPDCTASWTNKEAVLLYPRAPGQLPLRRWRPRGDINPCRPDLHYNCDDQNIDDVHNIFDL